MKALANNLRISFNEFGNQEITLTLTKNIDINHKEILDLKKFINENKKISLELKPYREKRSLDANSFVWVLIGKIADKLLTSKDEIYIQMLQKYGQREINLISVIAEASDIIYRATNQHCLLVGESELNGKLFNHFAILIGSSHYDTKEMSILIDGIVSEIIELGIDPIDYFEIDKIKNNWGIENNEIKKETEIKKEIIKSNIEIAIQDFIVFRKNIKKPMTDKAIILLKQKLDNLSENIDDQIKILEQSILNGWQGIFPLANTNKKNTDDRYKDW